MTQAAALRGGRLHSAMASSTPAATVPPSTTWASTRERIADCLRHASRPCSTSTAYDEPLPASTASRPAAPSTASRNAPNRGSSCSGGLEVVDERRHPSIPTSTTRPLGPASASHWRYTASVEHPKRRAATMTTHNGGTTAGSNRSPIPNTRAHRRASRTERRRRAERSAPRSATATGSASSERRPRSTPAASADPPPRPAPCGIRLCNRISPPTPSTRAGTHREIAIVSRHTRRERSVDNQRDLVGRHKG